MHLHSARLWDHNACTCQHQSSITNVTKETSHDDQLLHLCGLTLLNHFVSPAAPADPNLFTQVSPA